MEKLISTSLHYMTLNTSARGGGVKNVRPRKENKRPDKTSPGKDLTLFNLLHQPYTNTSYN